MVQGYVKDDYWGAYSYITFILIHISWLIFPYYLFFIEPGYVWIRIINVM